MGRQPLPNAVKIARGTLQPCRTTEESHIAIIEEVTVPKWLSTAAKKIFKEKAQILVNYRILSQLDLDSLAIYSMKMAEVIECEKDIRKNGMYLEVYTKDGTKYIMNPSIPIMKDDIKVINTIGCSFGFTPASRKVIADKIDHKKEVDEFSDFEDVI